MPGKTGEEVAEIVADILERLRYVDVEATFDALSELYPGARSEEERRRWLLLAQRLAHHELEIWKQAGPIVQSLLVERISALNDDALKQLRPVILEILEQVLEPEVSGTSSTYNTVTFHRGVVTPSDLLARTRSRAINTLEGLLRNAEEDTERRAVIHALSAAMRVPHLEGPSNRLTTTVLGNALRIVRFYTEVARDLSYELLQSLEHSLLWLYRHNRVKPDELEVGEAAEVRETLIQSILVFRDTVNADHGFVVYKTLVGFESVFAPAWENDGFDLEGERAYREQRIIEFVDQTTDKNADEWFTVLQRCARTESDDLATFPSFGQFLEKLGKSKPHIVVGYLDRLEGRLANFLPAMLTGLEKSAFGKDARVRVRRWVDQKRYLPQITRYLSFASEFDAALLEDALKGAIRIGETVAVLNAIAAANAHHADVAGLVDKVLLPALDYLASKSDHRWVNVVWFQRKKGSMFHELSSDQADAVLAALISHPEIDYHREDILAAIAANYPAKVVDFFDQRLASKEETEPGQRYDAIPFRFHLLHEPLATIPHYLIKMARSWFERDSSLFAYRGGRLLSIVFPNFSPEYERNLLCLVRGGSRLDLEFVTALLRAYEGQMFLHELCKEIVSLLTIRY